MWSRTLPGVCTQEQGSLVPVHLSWYTRYYTTPGTPPAHTVTALLATCCTRCSGEGEETAWAQRLPRAWVRCLRGGTLPRVVTVLRGFFSGRNVQEKAESDKDWIGSDRSTPYTGLSSILAEKADSWDSWTSSREEHQNHHFCHFCTSCADPACRQPGIQLLRRLMTRGTGGFLAILVILA